MKLKTFGAGITGVALVAGSMLLGALPANAATIPVTIAGAPPVETNPYSPVWFAGDVAGVDDGSATQTAAGLEIVGGTTGYQLLYGVVDEGITLTEASTGLAVSTTGGDAFYQIAVFGEPSAEFTTLRPADAKNLDGNWITSRAFGTYAAGDQATLAVFTAALDAGTPAEVLAFGVFVNAGDTVTLRAIGWNGDNYLFAAAPTATADPTTILESDVTATVTVTGSGFAPGETVAVTTSGPDGEIATFDEIADADGNVILTYSAADAGGSILGLGDYTTTFSDASGLFSASVTFSVVAAAVVPAAPAAGPTLPNTGVDAVTAIIAASVLLAAGSGFILFSMRRKTAAHI